MKLFKCLLFMLVVTERVTLSKVMSLKKKKNKKESFVNDTAEMSH